MSIRHRRALRSAQANRRSLSVLILVALLSHTTTCDLGGSASFLERMKNAAGAGIFESRWQSPPVIQNRYRVTDGWQCFQSYDDIALGVLRRIGNQLIDDKAERNSEHSGYINCRALDEDRACAFPLKQ
jgi:hypothetical protein